MFTAQTDKTFEQREHLTWEDIDEVAVVPLLIRFQFHSRLGGRRKAVSQHLVIYRNRNVRPAGRQSLTNQISYDIRFEVILSEDRL